MTEKSILEQALLQVQTLEEAVKQNAKGILASTMKQELNDLLKESLEDEEETEVPVDEQPEDEVTPEEEEDDMSDEDAEADDAEADDTENDEDLDNEEPSKDIEGLDSGDEEDEMDDDEELPSFDEEPSTEEGVEDEDVMDMTGASDEDVLKVFKAMKPEDGIVVKKDGNKLEFGDGEDDYIIKLDDEDETPSFNPENSIEDEPSFDDEEMNEEEEETIYEIEIDEEEDEEDDETYEVDAMEAARTKSNPHGNKGAANRAGLPSKKKYKAGSGVFGINEEVETLKKQNTEYKKALVLFKEKLNEVAVFNANLAYATRLFTEHSTTKQEKLNILKRFDSISTMNEAKNLFNTIKAELGTKTTVTESVVEKISNAPSTSSSQEVLAEAKAYENPQFKRMKDLMSKIK
jgi:hypothetical protein